MILMITLLFIIIFIMHININTITIPCSLFVLCQSTFYVQFSLPQMAVKSNDVQYAII